MWELSTLTLAQGCLVHCFPLDLLRPVDTLVLRTISIDDTLVSIPRGATLLHHLGQLMRVGTLVQVVQLLFLLRLAGGRWW